MYLFLIAFIPLFTIAITALEKNYKISSFAPQIIFSVFLATVVCCVREFFIYTSYEWKADVLSNFIYLFLWDALIPFVVLTILHYIFCKDESLYKAAALFPMLASFFAIYTPYTVISIIERHSLFLLFFKPVMYAGLCLYASVFAGIVALSSYKSKFFLFILAMILTAGLAAFPPLLQTFCYFNGESIVTYGMAAAYTAISLILFIIKNAKTTLQY